MEPNIVKGDEIERKIESNMGQLTLELLKSFGDNIIQVDAESNESLTASILLKKSIRLAKFLRKHGVTRGDTISTLSENRLEFCGIPVASFFVGASFAPLNPDYTEGELDHVMGLSKPKVVFASSTVASRLSGIMKKDFVKLIIQFDSRQNGSDVFGFNNIMEDAESDELDHTFQVPVYDLAETVATILCSSGTTGQPKGVMITHENMTSSIEILSKVISKMNIDENEDKNDTIVGITPFFQSFGFLNMYLHLLRGKTMIVFRKFKPKIFLDAIVKYRIRTLIVPPTLLVFLVKSPLVKEYDLSCVKEVIAGAAPLGREVEMELKNRFKFRHAGQSYGMTETTFAVITSPHIKAKIGSVGTVVPGMMAKVIDENGRALGPSEKGELCLKGPMIMKGYVGDEEATRNCIDPNKWLHTGDIAYYDADGYFFIVDRLKELIKYKGFQVSPSELEDLLLSNESVLDAAVIGLPDEYCGELPTAFVVRKQGRNVTHEELQTYMSARVSPQKQLRGGVVFIEEIPRNQMGKILRRKLREYAVKQRMNHKL